MTQVTGNITRLNIIGDIEQISVNGVIVHSGFTPLQGLRDLDDNLYTTVDINGLRWVVENLKVTKYADGSAIPNVTGNAAWAALTTGAYCNYNSETDYGLLYNFHALENLVYMKNNGVYDSGYRIPTATDWSNLITYLGGAGLAGGKLKEVGTDHWQTPNEGATDEEGFKALGGGFRQYSDGILYGLLQQFVAWSSLADGANAWSYGAVYSTDNTFSSLDSKGQGASVRLVKTI